MTLEKAIEATENTEATEWVRGFEENFFLMSES